MTKGLLSDIDRIEVVKYRIEKANRTYKEAVGSIENGFVETAANRLYYAAFMPFQRCLSPISMKQALIMV